MPCRRNRNSLLKIIPEEMLKTFGTAHDEQRRKYMGQAFRAASGILNKFVDCVYLSLLWFVCSIPVFTIGASTSALYYAVQKSIVHERSYARKEFLYSFKRNFKQATLLWLGFFVFGTAMLFGAYQSYSGAMPQVFLYVYVIIFAVLLMTAVYAFPYIARFEGGTPQIVKNCLMISVTNLPKTLLSLLLIAAAAVAVWVFFPLVFLLPALVMCGIESMMEKTFAKYMTEEEKQAEFERNRTWEN